ncbi:phospholipid phosphatase 5-like isoform X1 [Antedon mediterranea]|uniref:phospholipid phosphatase 5-like isoform X1 n=2 Tax=Antedon mediterranea TaxID=105859 RepID=UPI003AF66849
MPCRYKVNHGAVSVVVEVFIRIALVAIFLITEELKPFIRIIQPEEMWLYKNPVTPSYVTTPVMFCIAVFTPIVVIFIFFSLRGERTDLIQALLAVGLALPLCGIITNSIKNIYGRPRPDYFWRCFPDGKMTSDLHCTGDLDTVMEGRKSFPSGHSSFSFCGLTFCALYMMGKFHIFESQGRGSALKLCISGSPLFASLMIALSRTADYHHHWQDVLVGSLLGLSIAFMCYRQYYPFLTHVSCDKPYAMLTPYSELPRTDSRVSLNYSERKDIEAAIHMI